MLSSEDSRGIYVGVISYLQYSSGGFKHAPHQFLHRCPSHLARVSYIPENGPGRFAQGFSPITWTLEGARELLALGLSAASRTCSSFERLVAFLAK